MSSPPARQRDLQSVDPSVWKACAGVSTWIPAVGSLVYYFPQGHAEQAFLTPDFSSSYVAGDRPCFLCRVSAVSLLARSETNEVFARISLDPRVPHRPDQRSPESSVDESENGSCGGGDVKFFPKVLTPSDANNGGGFSVPRFCAENIFPKLDMSNKAKPPAQALFVRDMLGNVWKFQHIYRGTPRRHLLTTGWSKFVNSKKLIAGDTVIFIRNGNGELFVGIRRTVRPCGIALQRSIQYTSPTTGAEIKLDERSFMGEGYWRSLKGRVAPESVVEAARLAEMGSPFEVVYFPRVGSPDFVVAAQVVEKATSLPWAIGVRVRMGMETDDSLRTTWFQGTVSAFLSREQGIWPKSPWRGLQITWDEGDALQQVRSVSPWEVEFVSTIPQIQCPYPATKRIRITEPSEVFGDKESNMFLPATGFGTAGRDPSLFQSTFFPAGMQGARHDTIGVSSVSNFATQTSYLNHKKPSNFCNGEKTTNPGDISTELMLGGSSLSVSSSTNSQASAGNSFKWEVRRTKTCKHTEDSVGSTFKLFGQIIVSGNSQKSDLVDSDTGKAENLTEDALQISAALCLFSEAETSFLSLTLPSAEEE